MKKSVIASYMKNPAIKSFNNQSYRFNKTDVQMDAYFTLEGKKFAIITEKKTSFATLGKALMLQRVLKLYEVIILGDRDFIPPAELRPEFTYGYIENGNIYVRDFSNTRELSEYLERYGYTLSK